MAGDWIKMRCNLWDDPRIARICDMTGEGEAAVIGGLYWLWAAADQHTEDGVMPGLSLKQIDRKTGLKCFGDALVSIGWIIDGAEGVQIVRFEEHNGSSAKRRCSESRRKMSARDADKERTESGQAAEESQQSCAPREREDIDISTSLRSVDSAPEKRVDKRAAQLPADFYPDATGIELAESLQVNVAIELQKFSDYHKARGKPMKDWQAAWRTWARNSVEFKRSSGGTAYQTARQISDTATARALFGSRAPVQERLITGEVIE
jgi:hypothetical protein